MLCYLSLTFRSKLDIVTNLRKKKKNISRKLDLPLIPLWKRNAKIPFVEATDKHEEPQPKLYDQE